MPCPPAAGKPFDPEGVAESVAHVRTLIDAEVAAGIPLSRSEWEAQQGGRRQMGRQVLGCSQQLWPTCPHTCAAPPAILWTAVVVGGFSQGGHVAYKTALQQPAGAPLGGCVALSTWLEPSLKDVRRCRCPCCCLRCRHAQLLRSGVGEVWGCGSHTLLGA